MKLRLLPVLLLGSFPLVACTALGIEAPVHPERGFQSRWDETPDRVWVSRNTWANRLQDWRVEAGELRCVEARPRFGMRTLHLLTQRLGGDEEGSFRVTVRVDAAAGERAGSAAGFLVGAGGAHVDPRLTTQVHGTSAEDGGYLALLGADGRVELRSFEEPVAGARGNEWSMGSDREVTDFVPLEGVRLAGAGFGPGGPVPVALELVGARYDGRRTLTLTARDAASGAVLSTAYLERAPESAFDGAVALVSHRGPRGADGAVDAGYRFRDWRLDGGLVVATPEVAFGPILFVHYTVDEGFTRGDGVLRMTAQAGPLGPGDARVATLELADEDGDFALAAEAPFVPGSATFHFEVPGVDTTRDVPFRVRYVPKDRRGEPVPSLEQVYGGVVAAAPEDGAMTIAVLSCQKSYTGGLRWNERGLWFPHAEVAEHVAAHGPDLLYFAGDQIYEGDLTPAVRAPLAAATDDYLTKWFRHGWSFGELTRRLPAVVVPDDHDVYHGNVWGNGGVRAEGEGLSAQDRGGYVMEPAFVNAVHRTQVAHLPPPFGPPLPVGITTYHTTLTWGGGSFAVLADRMFKSPPAVVVPEGEVKNGWPQAEGFDAAAQADVAGAVLLGPDQLAMLDAWGRDGAVPAWFRACLSQTPFANVATLPAGARSGSVIPSLEVPEPGVWVRGDERAADMDSNGWPQAGRDRAVRALARAGAFHLAGDQHLGSTLRYGIDAFDDGPYVLASPAVANTWPRRWFPDPADRQPGGAIAPGTLSPLGRFFDGFGNRMTVLAVANPRRRGVEPTRLHDRAPGYGIARVERAPSGGIEVQFENWPRHVDPEAPDASPYEGWPVRVTLPGVDRAEAEPRGSAGEGS